MSSLKDEIAALPLDAWVTHPNKHLGNMACIIKSTDGGINHDTKGEMRPTKWLERLPSVQKIMDALPCEIERTRLMALYPGCEVPLHTDEAVYWRERVRIHVPIITDPKIEFHVKGNFQHMGEGECWIFDTSKPHSVYNCSDKERIHLVMDTLGSLELWDAAAA